MSFIIARVCDVGVLHFQLKETPQDFFVDIVMRHNFLVRSLTTFFAHVRHTPNVPEDLKSRALKFMT